MKIWTFGQNVLFSTLVEIRSKNLIPLEKMFGRVLLQTVLEMVLIHLVVLISMNCLWIISDNDIIGVTLNCRCRK